MKHINLAPFCEKHSSRGLDKPWTRCGQTYATDGRIIVAVPARDNVADNPAAPGVQNLGKWDHNTVTGWQKLPGLEWKTCGECGTEHAMPCCEDDQKVGKHTIAANLIVKLATLPDCEIAPDWAGLLKPVPIRFTGGCGYVMPMRKS